VAAPVRHGGARRTAAIDRLDRGREMRAGPARQRGRRGESRVADRRPLDWLAGGPALRRGEVGHDWAENRRWAKVQKEIIFKF
jgi:hypothetical protein